MASTCFTLPLSSPFSLVHSRTGAATCIIHKRTVSCSLVAGPTCRVRFSSSRALGVVEGINGEETSVEYQDDAVLVQGWKKWTRPCEIYVCNLPRSCDLPELVEMFKPFGTVLSVEVSRNAETGVSRGCGYVTMSTINEAKVAIAALDGSDLGGREMRVRFSVDMNPRRMNRLALNSPPKREILYESPYKLYVGNVPQDVKPEDLRNHFSQFGTVVSVRFLHDRKAGKSRCYGFLSFSSAAERDAAICLHGTEFYGRTLVVREGVERNQP